MTAAFVRLVATLAVLGLVGWVNGLSPIAGDRDDTTASCEIDPPRDVAGLEACLARSPHDVELLLNLGLALEAEGRQAAAGSAYQRAVDADPGDADARLQLAAALRRAGHLDDARRQGQAALHLRPNDPAAAALAAAGPVRTP